MKKKLPPALSELLEKEKSISPLDIPIPIGLYNDGSGIDNKTGLKHYKYCVAAKVPYITISNGIPSEGKIDNPANGFKTPVSFIRCDISWFLDENPYAQKHEGLLEKRIQEFCNEYKYMLAPKRLLNAGVKKFSYRDGKAFAAVQWCYGNIYARLLCILLLDFMRSVELPDAEIHFVKPITELLPLAKSDNKERQ